MNVLPDVLAKFFSKIFKLDHPFLFLCVLLICNGIAGPKNAVFWYVLITLTMLVLTVGYRIARKSR
jgi:hypothetical protein